MNPYDDGQLKAIIELSLCLFVAVGTLWSIGLFILWIIRRTLDH